MQRSNWKIKIIQFLFIPLGLIHLNTALANGIDPKIRQALAYLDRGEASQAINILEPLAKKHPSHSDLQTTLASAYVGMTHIRLKKFFPIFRKIQSNEVFSDDLERKREALFPNLKKEAARNNKDLKEFINAWEDVHRATSALMYAFEYLALVPKVNEKEFEALLKANQIYDEAQFSLSQGDAAFALLVHFTLIRYRIENNLYFINIDDTNQVNPSFYLHYSLNGIKYDLEQMFHYIEEATQRNIPYTQDFSEDWEKLEDFLRDNDLEINFLFENIDF